MKLSEVKIYGRPISDFLLPDQIEVAQKQLDESTPDGWVSVEDGLPGEHRRYLCMMFNENCFIEEVCLFEYSTKKWLFQNKYVTVTHYQPLPQPPKQ